VIIGHIFDNADPQGKYAKVVMRISEEKHSGPTVKNECFGLNENGRCQTVKSYISLEFRKVIAALNRGSQLNEIIDKMEKKRFDGKECRTHIIIRDIAEKYKDDTIQLANVLRTSQWDFEAGCIRRRDEVDKNIIFHERSLPYTDIYNILQGSIEDPDDIEIIINAHHVGLETCNLVLVSGGKHIIDFEGLICEYTSVVDIKSLKSFAGDN